VSASRFTLAHPNLDKPHRTGNSPHMSNAAHRADIDVSAVVREADTDIDAGRLADAKRRIETCDPNAADHAGILRVRARIVRAEKRTAEAIALLESAIARYPDDAALLFEIGELQLETADIAGAFATFEHATRLAPVDPRAWFHLGHAHAFDGDSETALAMFDRALSIAPTYAPARLGRALALQVGGRVHDAAGVYRALIAEDASFVPAWTGLAALNAAPFDASDVSALQSLYARAAAGDRIGLGFALAKALEDVGREPEAFAMLTRANAAKRRETHWDRAAFSNGMKAVRAAVAAPSSFEDSTRGREVVFVVSPPRSGSTLVEQMLAAHADVEGASELSDLNAIIAEESRRRGEAFPSWVPRADAADWERLGADYLERTARWRQRKPRFVDKALGNWKFIGAVVAMLPCARIVAVRRDPVETCLACYRQLFAHGQPFAYDLDDLAAFWRDYDRSVREWQRRYPRHVFALGYEALCAEPEAMLRDMLAFLDLPYDERCLRFHSIARDVRTASLAQVRRPLQRDTSRAARYGALLEPLRRALARDAD
jgi:tetratricopeptide (TPR) repeat protein